MKFAHVTHASDPLPSHSQWLFVADTNDSSHEIALSMSSWFKDDESPPPPAIIVLSE